MVVGCPKCKAKLKVADEKIKPEGTKFKCPRCQALLLVKRSQRRPAPPLQTPAPPPQPSYRHEQKEAPVPEPPKEEPVPERMAPPTEEPSGLPPLPKERPEESREEEAPEPGADTFGLPPLPEERPEGPAEEEASGAEFPGAPVPEADASFKEAVAGQPPSAAEPAAPAPFLEAPAEAEEGGAKVLLAHPSAELVNMLKFVLSGANFTVINATDGVTAMVKAMKEQPDVAVLDVTLPKIHGIEVMKRMKARPETNSTKIILVGTKPEEQVTARYGASAYIHQDRLQQGLVELLRSVLLRPPAAAPAAEPEGKAAEPEAAVPAPKAPAEDPGIAKAHRFSRTVFADIYLYNPDKVKDSIRAGTFEQVFSKEISDGLKLYESRIPADVREKGDFYNEEMAAFLKKKRAELGL